MRVTENQIQRKIMEFNFMLSVNRRDKDGMGTLIAVESFCFHTEGLT